MLFPDSWMWDAPWAAYLLLLLPPLVWGIFWWQRKHPGAFVYGNTLALRQVPTDLLGRLWWLPGTLRVGVVVLLIIAIARPQEPNERVVTSQGVDVVIALDMSASMNAVDKPAQEIDAAHRKGYEPNNRFDVARELLIEFIRKRADNGDRVGLVIFGHGAYVKFPLTTDYRRAIKDVKSLVLDDGRRRTNDPEACMNECTISGANTTIGDALKRAFLRVRDSKATDRSIILITDGEDMGSKTAPRYVADFIRDWGKQVDPKTKEERRPIRIYTFLIGGGKHTFTPDINPLTMEFRRTVAGHMSYHSARGRFPANPDLLDYIAKETGGQFFQSYDEEAFRKHFADLEKTEFERTVSNFPDEQFMPFAWAAFAFLFFEAFLRLTIFRKFP